MSGEFIWDGRGDRGEDARYSVVSGRAASDLRLLGLHFRILCHVGRFNHRKGWCRLSQSDLAEMFGVRRQNVSTYTNQLVKWRYLEKRSQKESGESFCLYRVVLDDDWVSATPDTPTQKRKPRGVSAIPDTSVRPDPTPVSATKAPYSDHVDHIELHTAPLTPAPVDNVADETYSRDGHKEFEQAKAALASSTEPIPFDENAAGAKDLTGYIDGMAKVDGAIKALATGKPYVDPNGRREPFTTRVLAKIRPMCIDLEALIGKFHERARELKAAGAPIKDPSGYLYRMAVGVVAQREGVAAEIVERMYADDAKTRVAAQAEAVGVDLKPPPPAWRVRAAVNTDRSRLAAALESRR